MQIKINGAVDEIPDNSSIQDVLTARKVPVGVLVIGLNGEIIKRENWASLRLNANDNLELIRLIGGG